MVTINTLRHVIETKDFEDRRISDSWSDYNEDIQIALYGEVVEVSEDHQDSFEKQNTLSSVELYSYFHHYEDPRIGLSLLLLNGDVVAAHWFTQDECSDIKFVSEDAFNKVYDAWERARPQRKEKPYLLSDFEMNTPIAAGNEPAYEMEGDERTDEVRIDRLGIARVLDKLNNAGQFDTFDDQDVLSHMHKGIIQDIAASKKRLISYEKFHLVTDADHETQTLELLETMKTDIEKNLVQTD